MKLFGEVAGIKHDVEIRRSEGRLSAVVDSREYDLEISEPEPNVFLLKHQGRIFEAFVSPDPAANAPYHVKIGNAEIEASVTDPKRLRGSSAADDHAAGQVEIRTAMPGKIVRILVSTGDAVQKGDGVLVVEAMKMQNEMRSPKDGVIKEIRTTEGSTVNAGDILAVIE